MASAKDIIQNFDVVNFILAHGKDHTVDELSMKLRIPLFKLRQLCYLLAVQPKGSGPIQPVKTPGVKPKLVRVETKDEEEYLYSKKIIPDGPRKPIVRPPASYTNIPTPFGIATQMLEEQLKEESKIKKTWND